MKSGKTLSLSYFSFENWRWLFCPSKTALIFAFRTILASYIALAIALWMEMDSPRWAIMSVWVVAQNSSRGEILSKAYWVILGNIVGIIAVFAIMASFPQQSLLFEVIVALWVALCCWFASCTRHFLSFGWSMAGFSCAIVLFASVNDPNTTFMMAMSRGSYFILGIFVENLIARLFEVNLHHYAHQKLNKDLRTAVEGALASIIHIIEGKNWEVAQSDQILTSIIALNHNVEFREIELKGTGHTGDHARATLSSISALLVKAMGFSIHLREMKGKTLQFYQILPHTKSLISSVLMGLKEGNNPKDLLLSINALRWECRQKVSDSFYKCAGNIKVIDNQYTQRALNDRILYQSLREILAELETTLLELSKSQDIKKQDNFKFAVKFPPDYKRAARNAIRAFVTITVGCLLWEITGWHNASVFLAFLCMGCSRFCVFDNISVACIGWFKGICIAILSAFFFNMIIMPWITVYEVLCMVLIVPLGIGALAMCTPKYAPIAGGYMFFFCYLLGFSNSGRVDEISFFNDSLALFLSGLVALIAYQIVFPYHQRKLKRQMRQKLLHGLHNLANTRKSPLPREWINFVSGTFSILMNQLGISKNSGMASNYRHGSMAVMLIGINIIRLRAMIEHDIITEDIRNILRVVLRRVAKFQGQKAKYGQHARTVMIAHRAIARFRQRETTEKNLAVRMEISVAISALILMTYALDKNAPFLRVKSHNMLFY
ncbi:MULTISPECIES: FUSC family protein [Commensalibacter]|uniref:Fusaric acid resistance protein n=2 Tax=Commensalibacter TaxID=1079922 RepID=W7E7T9_9PROT|nr:MULTISPECIES: FUSC family protein [Commensalibacter]EUK19201.1 fusaric acid resistance protein [Commensalibacter papalotli (ex Servin-Garciduenas et al. 2014)]CAI3931171.1 Uncharacterized membrane protein YccC (YccC) [Commensalibacter papalotli (ex Botero et al. 2024)]CAI3947509.1 Uncharacterized membrane protein YccC (YccC) [Commensalibacter papalotli (ex Botero et al. 2024)]